MNVRISDILHAPFLLLLGIVLLPVIPVVLIWDYIWWKIRDIKNKIKKKKEDKDE
jgi:membrane protein DedA with SNARE-associated domain